MTTRRKKAQPQPRRLPLAAVALLAGALLALSACATQDDPAPGSPSSPPAIPAIDRAAPERTETATFALG